MLDELRRIALVTSGVAELTRNRAEQIVRDLVRSGDVRRESASSTVKELLAFAKENRREVIGLLRAEVQSQVESLGVVTKRDIERLERRITRLEDRASSSGSGSGSSATRKSTTRKSTAKKSAAKRSTRKTTRKKTSSSKSNAAKSNTPKSRGPASGTSSSGGGSDSSSGSSS